MEKYDRVMQGNERIRIDSKSLRGLAMIFAGIVRANHGEVRYGIQGSEHASSGMSRRNRLIDRMLGR